VFIWYFDVSGKSTWRYSKHREWIIAKLMVAVKVLKAETGSRLNHALQEEDKIREKGTYQHMNDHDSCLRQIRAMHNVESWIISFYHPNRFQLEIPLTIYTQVTYVTLFCKVKLFSSLNSCLVALWPYHASLLYGYLLIAIPVIKECLTCSLIAGSNFQLMQSVL